MSITIPNLDDTTYADLVNRMVESIPKYTWLWTDFNFSDPGITLLQLLCWIAESLLYRANYIPIETYINFLQLLAGAAGDEIDKKLMQTQQAGLDPNYEALLLFLKNIDPKTTTREEIRTAALSFFTAPYLAVTEDDYTQLTLDANQILIQENSSYRIARAIILSTVESVTVICVANIPDVTSPQSDTSYQQSLNVTQSNILKAPSPTDDPAYEAIIPTVEQYLAPRLLIGTITTVQAPVFTPVNIELQVIATSLSDTDELSQLLIAQIEEFLSPYPGGGTDGNGWTYNQAPTTQDINHLVITTPGVSYIQSLNINFYPTQELDTMSFLNVNAILGDAPDGMTIPQFVGLAQLQILNLTVTNETE